MKLLPFILFLTIAVSAQTPKPNLTEINTYAASVDRFMKVNKTPRYFGDVSLEEKSHWKRFKTRKLIDDAEEVYKKAVVWSKTGKIVSVGFTLTSPSGDWAHYVTYYFRTDGSLAKIHAELNTFYGEVSIIRDRFYDPSGQLLQSTQKVLDLQTRKPKKPSGDFMDQDVNVYKKVSELPFSKML